MTAELVLEKLNIQLLHTALLPSNGQAPMAIPGLLKQSEKIAPELLSALQISRILVKMPLTMLMAEPTGYLLFQDIATLQATDGVIQ